MDYELFERLKADPSLMDNLLEGGGRQLGDVNLDKLSIKVMPSGFPSLDTGYMLLKDSESEVIIVSGRPSSGKSAFMFQLALSVSQTMPVHVFSLEMSQESIVRRLMSQMLQVPISNIQNGWVDRDLLETARKKLLNDYKYYIDDDGGLSIAEIMDRAITKARKFKTQMVVIDYLQIIGREKDHSADAEIGRITSSLKKLAKQLKCTVVVGCQLNRQCETRGSQTGNYQPLLSDLRESGNIEQDADIVLAIHREERYTKLRPGEADVIILKNRNGAVGTVAMKYIASQTSFIDESVEI
jgi:replicative DNA helicase